MPVEVANEIYVVIATDDDGSEGIVSHQIGDHHMTLMVSRPELVNYLKSAARDAARGTDKKNQSNPVHRA